MNAIRVNGNNGYTLIEVLVVVVLMGLTSLAVVGIMSALNQSLSDSNQRMILSTFGMELKNHLGKTHTNGIGYCMFHPTIAGAKFSSKSLGTMLNSVGNAKLQQIISGAKANAGDASLKVTLDNEILFTGNSIYGGDGLQKSADYLSLLKSELHSFVIRKTINAYVVNQPMAIVVSPSVGKSEYMFLVSALLENQFYKGEIPSDPANLKAERTGSSRIEVNFVIRNIGGTYSIVDCGMGTLARTTAFVESCKALGADFEYVVDRPTIPRGQCYIPQYYPVLGSSPDGLKEGVIRAYTPLRAFLCEGAFGGKSLNMPFCTGEY